jgi:succinate-semialdehyde dehydrogenase/glutarate-semialdehyde dehydrogenase
MPDLTALDALVIGNGRPPALPIHLTPSRLRTLVGHASYADDADLGRERATNAVVAPFSGEAVAHIPSGTETDVEQAFTRARRAQEAWAARPLYERAAVLLRYHDWVLNHQDEGMDLVQLESGKARTDAFYEVFDVATVARHYAVQGRRILERDGARGALPLLTRTEVNHVPVGTVGIIAPWNYPLSMAITDALPALLAGNAVVLKPAEQTPLTALWAAEGLYSAGLPRDLLHVVPGKGSEIGTPIIDRADFVCFTGSTEVGRKIGEQCGRRLIGCSLELGGKNPMIVLDDADLDRAVEGAVVAAFSSGGQLCIAAERLYVHASLADAFATRFAARIREMRVGPGYAWDTDMGSLVSQEQLDKVVEHVDDAVAKGAEVLTGGRARPDLGPFFFEPTLLRGVPETALLFREETFGPVVSLYTFETEEEAVALANDSDFGLNASVWTGSVPRGLRVARRIASGTVNVNDAYAAAWGSLDAPMGGVKQSGLGRRHGDYGLLKYTEAQTVAVQRLMPAGVPPWMAPEQFAHFATAALRLIKHLPGLR